MKLAVACSRGLSYLSRSYPPIGTDRVGPCGGPLFLFVARLATQALPHTVQGKAVNLASEPVRSRTEDTVNRRFVHETGAAAEIATLAEPVLGELGLRLVRVLISGRDGGTVQVMIDRADKDVTVEDCADVSRALSPLLDAHDPMPGRYTLEVSSPGIDRPLVRPSDFEDWAGHDAKLQLREAVDGRKRFRGVIEGYEPETQEVRLAIELEGEREAHILGFPASLIESAKLVMTDALIDASRARRGLDDPADGGED